MNDLDLMLTFMLQVIVVLAACKLFGWFGNRFLGQAQVTMEMVTGVILGPSLFGLLAPDVQAWLFPKSLEVFVRGEAVPVEHPSMSILYVIAQIGLVLYMFLIGMEFNVKLISGRIKGAVLTSVAGIALPFAFGAILCLTVLKDRTDLFSPSISTQTATLYLGAAMSITAFPMLARILYEAGLANTSMGTLALGAGATDDAAAWSLLAVVLAISKNDPTIALWAIGGGVGFAVLMFTFGRKLLRNLERALDTEGRISQNVFMSVILLVFAGAWFTDAIGIYAVFGAFIVGASMPRGKIVDELNGRLHQVVVALFLPFFFVYSGLNTQINLINSVSLWEITGFILLAAIAGKFGGCYLASRLAGEPHRESLAIGTLMNARGLMELIILNIGLQQHVITAQLFTIMVMMAIVTTLMTGPMYRLVYGANSTQHHRFD